MDKKSSGTGNEVGQSNYFGDQARAEQYSQPDNKLRANRQPSTEDMPPGKNEQPAGDEAETGGQKSDGYSAANKG